MPRHVAIVEDDPVQAENYADALKAHGFGVAIFPDRASALAAFRQRLPDLAVLDVMLGDDQWGGFDLCRDLLEQKAARSLPFIFLTARDSAVDKASGLHLGAWDYITKPVDLQYLPVRIDSLFRLAEKLRSGTATTDIVHRGNLAIDRECHVVRWRDRAIELSYTEYEIVEALARRPGHVKTYESLMTVTRQRYVEKNSINSYVKRIREKFKSVDTDFDEIETVYGMGYRWRAH